MIDYIAKFYRWILVTVFFCIYFLNATFPYYGASVINAHMAKALSLDRMTLGLGFSIFSVSQALSAPIIGVSVNKIGVRLTLSIGAGLLIIGSFLMATIVTGPWGYILVFGIIIALGINMGTVIPIQTGVTFWFKKRKALAMSIVLSAAGVGALIAAPMLNKVIIASNNNWKSGWIVIVAASVLSAVLAVTAVRNKPEDIGQLADGINPNDSGETASGNGAAVLSGTYQSTDSWKPAEAFKTCSLWLIILASIAFLMPYITCVAHGVVHLQGSGFHQGLAALSVGLLVFFSIIGRICSGIFGDRVEPRIIWSAALFLVTIGMIFLAHASAIGSFAVYLYALLVGAGFGAAYVCMATIIGNYFGVHAFASIMSAIFPVIFLTAAMGPFLAGFLFDRQETYITAFSILTALTLIGAVAVLFAKPPVNKV